MPRYESATIVSWVIRKTLPHRPERGAEGYAAPAGGAELVRRSRLKIGCLRAYGFESRPRHRRVLPAIWAFASRVRRRSVTLLGLGGHSGGHSAFGSVANTHDSEKEGVCA